VKIVFLQDTFYLIVLKKAFNFSSKNLLLLQYSQFPCPEFAKDFLHTVKSLYGEVLKKIDKGGDAASYIFSTA